MKTKYFSNAARIATCVGALMLAGCVSFPQTNLDAKNREKVHSIGVLQTKEPAQESVMNMGGAAAGFGLLGALVQAGVNSSHTNTYSQKVTSGKIYFGPVVDDGIVSTLTSDGYRIAKLYDQRAKISPDGKSDDYSAVETDADAILSVSFVTFGYISPPEAVSFVPWVVLRARLLDAKTKQDLYFKTFACGYDIKANSVHIDSDAQYAYGTFGKLEERFDQSVEGLKACEQAVVKTIGQDFAKTS